MKRIIPRRVSLKVTGRKKVQFHLDDLVLIEKRDGRYFWFCKLAEANGYMYGAGAVGCDGCGLYFETQHDAEEHALTHLALIHRGVGGQRRPRRSDRDAEGEDES